MTNQQRQIRQSIRNAYITATLAELTVERDRRSGDGQEWQAKCLQEMIDECNAEGVASYGDVSL